MIEPKVTAGFYPPYEGDIETSAKNIFNSMSKNINVSLKKNELKEEANVSNNNKKISNKRRTPFSAGKGAINYMQLPN